MLIADNNLIFDELIYKLRPLKLKFVEVYFYKCTYKRIILYLVKSNNELVHRPVIIFMLGSFNSRTCI